MTDRQQTDRGSCDDIRRSNVTYKKQGRERGMGFLGQGQRAPPAGESARML